MFFCNIQYIIFDLISMLKSSSFKENMIISMSFRGIHVLEYVEMFTENFFCVKKFASQNFALCSKNVWKIRQKCRMKAA